VKTLDKSLSSEPDYTQLGGMNFGFFEQLLN
jgi:hypothetical protein